VEKPQEKPPVPNPRPIETSPIEWFVITPDRLPNGENWVYYGITPKQYETLSRNMADILRWVKEAQWRLQYYRGEGKLDGQRSTGDERVSGEGG
jgi:hypothetical protein